MEAKYMRRENWRRILERESVLKSFTKDGVQGAKSLLFMKKVREPLYVTSGSSRVKVVDEGYGWMQIALENQPIWMTAMYDDQNHFLQMYFDVTDGNCFDDPENPCFPDLYLDVIVTLKGEICVLDQDELDAAFAEGEITKEQYERAQAVCSKLCEWLQVHKEEIIEYSNGEYLKLKSEVLGR